MIKLPCGLDRLFLSLICLSLVGCSGIFRPYVEAPATFPENTNDYEEVVVAGRMLQEEMRKRLSSLETYETTTGILQLGSALAASGLGIFDASDDAILATGLGTASLIGARRLVPSQRRKAIYAAGMSAIDCAVASTRLMPDAADTGFRARLEAAIADINRRVDSLAGRGARLSFDGDVSKRGTDGYTSLWQFKALLGQQSRQMQTRTLAVAAGKMESQEARAIDRMNILSRKLTDMLAQYKASFDTRRAQALATALRGILGSIRAQLLQASLDPDGATQAAAAQVEMVVASLTEPTDDADESADQADNENSQMQDQAQSLMTTAEAVSDVVRTMDLNGDMEGEANAMMSQAAAAMSEADNIDQIVADARAAIGEIQRLSGVAEACFPGITDGNS